MGAEYKCDQCGREYERGEERELDRVPVDPDDPERRQGYHKVCVCGAEFWVDRWTRQETVEVNGDGFHISSVFLHINHGYKDEDLWYETLLSGPGGSEHMERYETREEAETGHEELVERLQAEEYHFEPTGKRLVLHDSKKEDKSGGSS